MTRNEMVRLLAARKELTEQDWTSDTVDVWMDTVFAFMPFEEAYQSLLNAAGKCRKVTPSDIIEDANRRDLLSMLPNPFGDESEEGR